MAAPLRDGPIQGSTPTHGATPPDGSQQNTPPPRIEGKITPTLNRLSTHQNTVPVSRDAGLGITMLAKGFFTQLPPLPPTPPNIPLPKTPNSATATQSSKSFQKANATKDSTKTRSETTNLGSRILMGKKGQEEDVFGEDKPPSDQQTHQNDHNNNTQVSEKPTALKQAEQNLKARLEHHNHMEEKIKVMADELNAMPPHLKTEQQQHQYDKQEGAVYAARKNVIKAEMAVIKATPRTAENEAFLTSSMAKLEAEGKSLHYLCLLSGEKIAGGEVKILKDILKTLKDETAIKETEHALQHLENVHLTFEIHLIAEESFVRAEQMNRGESIAKASAQEITTHLAKAPENTAVKAQEIGFHTLSTSEVPATETVKQVAPSDDQAKLDQKKRVLGHQIREVYTTEKTFTAQLKILLQTKEAFLNPNSPDNLKFKEHLEVYYNGLSKKQKKEFDVLFKNLFDAGNIEKLLAFSEPFAKKFEELDFRHKEIEAKLKNEDLTDHQKAGLLKEQNEITKQMCDIFSNTKFPEDILNAANAHLSAETNFKSFLDNNSPKQFQAVMEKLNSINPGIPPDISSVSITVVQRFTRYPGLASAMLSTLNNISPNTEPNAKNRLSDPEYTNTTTNAAEALTYFTQKATELNTLKAHLDDTTNALKMATTINTNPHKSGRLVGEGEIPAQRQRLKTNIRELASPYRPEAYSTPAATKKPLEEHETLKNVRDTLQTGVNAQNALIEKKSEMLKQAKTVAEQNKLSEEIQDHRVIIADLVKSASKINNSEWAIAVDTQGKTRKSMNLEAINKTSVELTQTLNLHNPPLTITVNAPGTPLTEFNTTNERAKNILLGATYKTKEKDLETLEAQAQRQLEGFINEITKPKKYEEASNVETALSNPLEAQVVRTEDKITKELLHLEVFVRDHPEFESAFLKLSDALLEKANRPPLSEKGYGELENDLKQISEGIRMVEASIMHKQEIAVLAQPERVAARENVHEATRIAKKSSELSQLKETLKTALAEDVKLKMQESGVQTTKRASTFLHHVSKILHIDTKRFQGTDSGSAAVMHLMLKTLDDTNDAGLRSQVNEIITLMKTEGSWTNAVIKKHSSVGDALTKLEDKLTKLPPSTQVEASTVAGTPLNIVKELFDPPGNPQLEKAFLNSSHLFVSNLTVAKGTPDANLFAFLKENLENATTLYQQQKIVDLAQKWIEDPFINGGKVKNREADIRELATLAAGSATMNVSVAKLLETLETVVATPATQPPTAGSKSILHTLENIANGSPKPGSSEYQQAVTELANSITAQSTASFKAINSTDFVAGNWGTNLIHASNEFNNLARFVELSILEPTTAHAGLDLAQQRQQSARVMEFFVNVQAELISPERPIVNLNDFMAINGALNSAAIMRLTTVRDLLPDEILQKQEDHAKLVSVEKNSSALRTKMNDLSNNKQPFIPYIGLLRTDITFANDGNNTINSGNKELNSKKVAILGNIVDSAGEMNRNITSTPRPSYNLSEIGIVGSSYSEKTAYEKSLSLNPRPARPISAPPETK
jgi:hypothetical protein